MWHSRDVIAVRRSRRSGNATASAWSSSRSPISSQASIGGCLSFQVYLLEPELSNLASMQYAEDYDGRYHSGCILTDARGFIETRPLSWRGVILKQQHMPAASPVSSLLFSILSVILLVSSYTASYVNDACEGGVKLFRIAQWSLLSSPVITERHSSVQIW